MKKRLLACLLTAAMLVSLFPLSALAAEVEPYTGGLCHHHQEHSYEDCGYIEAVEGRPCGYVCHICPVQAMIDALPAPKDITAENRAGVEAQLEAIGEAWAELSEEDALRLDTARLEAARDALAALAGLAGNELPAPLAVTVDNVEYWDENGNKNTKNGVNVVDSTTTWAEGWYVVNSNVEISDRVTVTGDVHLILANSCTLEAKNGITVEGSDSLTIYAQSSGSSMGILNATGKDGNAGIGGNGGVDGGTITINGGTVTATSEGYGAGIGGGGGSSSAGGNGGKTTISGGTVTATSEGYGAGIGGGGSSSNAGGNGGKITISGGTVTATSEGYGAGIGGGGSSSNAGGNGGKITISGGTVTATSEERGAGIGCGGNGDGDQITISGNAEVTATSEGNGAGIGGGAGGSITISGGTVTATSKGDGEGIGCWKGGSGTFSTGQNGNAFIVASSIQNQDDKNQWSGVIFVDGVNGEVYGAPILKTDATIPAGNELVIESGQTLTIGKGVTLINEGTLTIESGGTLVNNGKLVNNSSNQGITGGGTIQGDGELTGNGKIEGGITIIRPTVPAITTQPVDQSVSIGQKATFTIVSSGTPAPTCQWQVNKGNGWENIPDAATSSYTTEAASMGMNGWRYRCVVTNSAGRAESDPATLTVQKAEPPAATPQHLNIANHLAKTYTYRLSNLRPQLPEGASWENVTYELTSVSFTETGYYTAGTAEIIQGPGSQTLNTLSLPILFNDVTTEGKVGTVTVTIRSDNYQDFTNTLEIIASNKEAVIFSGVTGVTVPYTGQPVKGYTGELVIKDSNGGTVTPDLEISYTGRLETSYKGTQPPTEVGTYSVIFRVADTDARYIGRLAVNFEITKAQGGGDGPDDPGGGNGGGGYTPPTYKPDVSKPGEGGGTPTVTPSNPKPGDTVTVKPKPDDGYEVDTITVTDKNGKPVEVTVKPDGTYTFKQPSGKVTIEVSYKPIETPWNNPFADVSENDWYYEAVRFVQERGLMNGIGNGNFAPNAQLSRAQLAQILFNKEGRPGVNYLLTFPDVASEAWYTEAVRWAASQGIVGGYGDGTFGPNDPITREQLAVMLWRYSGSPAATSRELHFNDTDEISGFALEALRWAVENGILNGYGDGRLGPQGQATRAQVAQMLKNFIENQEETT